MSAIQVTWPTMKSFADARQASIQWLDIDGNYYLAAFDGPFELRCTLPQDSVNAIAVAEFEASYKALGNKSPKSRVIQTLGEDNFTMNPRALIFSAPTGQTSTHYKLLDAALAVKGGVFFASGATIGDVISVKIEDKDNVLGYGAGVILKDYVPEWAVMPGVRQELEDVSIGFLPVAGLYLRVDYTSVAAPGSTVGGALNLISYLVAE